MINILAFIWGGVWATFHQFHPVGKYLLLKRTWLTVASGCTGNLILLKLVLPKEQWLKVLNVFFWSALFVVYRSTHSELSDMMRHINGIKNQTSK